MVSPTRRTKRIHLVGYRFTASHTRLHCHLLITVVCEPHGSKTHAEIRPFQNFKWSNMISKTEINRNIFDMSRPESELATFSTIVECCTTKLWRGARWTLKHAVGLHSVLYCIQYITLESIFIYYVNIGFERRKSYRMDWWMNWLRAIYCRELCVDI